MEQNLMDYPDSQIDITEYHTDYSILNDRSEKSSSGVWKHFGTLKHNNSIDRKHVYCIQCFLNRKIKKYQRSTSTGNLSKHLKKYHRISLNQSFRIKKEPDNNTFSIQKEQSLNVIDDDNLNGASVNDDSEEFLIHDINEILITEVGKRPLLYNSTACQREKGLKHQTRRQLWMEIYEALNQLIPYARLPKIWKNIRDRYHKVRRSRNAPDDYRPRYRYYEMLRFLDDTKSADPSPSPRGEHSEEYNYVEEFLSSNDNGKYISSEATNAMADLAVKSFEPKGKKVKISLQVNQDGTENTKHEILSSLANGAIEDSSRNVTNNKVHLELDNESEVAIAKNSDEQLLHLSHNGPLTNIADASCSIPTIALKPIPSIKKQDEYDIFGNFMAEVMRNMTKSKSRMLQMNILGLISDAET